MSKIPQKENDNTAALKKSATIWAAVIGVVTMVLVFWILDQQTSLFRIGAAVAGGVVVAIAMYRKSIKAGVNPKGQDNNKL